MKKITTRQRLDRAVLEKDFQEQVIDIAHLFHWKVAHFRPARTLRGWSTPVAADGAGFPDLCLVNIEQERVVWIECKREGQKLSEQQQDWILALENSGQEVYVFHPSEFEQVTELLRGK